MTSLRAAGDRRLRPIVLTRAGRQLVLRSRRLVWPRIEAAVADSRPGSARRLSAAVAVNIEARGERPFLHAWKTNLAAIALYESLGFETRTEVKVAVIERSSS